MGYEYEDELLMYDDDEFVIAYIDGACSNNGGWNAAAGLGVVFNYNHPW